MEFYIFHELRHIHQQASITLKNQNQPTNEPYEEISKWENGFNNYKCNDGSAEAREENMAQEVELDANGYGLSLLNLYHIRDASFSFEYSLPEKHIDWQMNGQGSIIKQNQSCVHICKN